MSEFEHPPRAGRSAHNPLVHVAGWLKAAFEYSKARAQLVLIEAKEAGANYGIAAGMFGAALVLVLFGYLFLMMTLVFGIALLFEDDHAWIWVLAGVAVLHLGGAGALVMMALRRLKAEPFPCTKEELRNDKLWLHHSPKKS
jgi:uncharacterized membrane protein YqjE